MTSPNRLFQPPSQDMVKKYLKSPSQPRRTPSFNAANDMNLVCDIQIEKRANEFSQLLKSKLREAAVKSPTKRRESEENEDVWRDAKEIQRRAEDYKDFIRNKCKESEKYKQEEIQDINSRMNSAVEELESFKEKEYAELSRKMTKFQNEFTKKVNIIERLIEKEIEKAKTEMIAQMRQEEKETERKIYDKSIELVEKVAPTSKRELLDKSLNSYPSDRSSISSKRSSSVVTPVRSSPDKRIRSRQAMDRAAESRQRVFEAQARSALTPSKLNYYESESISPISTIGGLSSHKPYMSGSFVSSPNRSPMRVVVTTSAYM